MGIKTWICRCFSKYGLVPLILAFACNCTVYGAAGWLVQGRELHSLAIGPDSEIPLVSWTILIYFGCYLFWAVNYTLIYRHSREKAYRFFVSDFLSRMICLFCYLIYPTTIARADPAGNSVFDGMIRWLYQIDAPVNLFPSIHCLVSWNCYIGIRTDETIPVWYRRCSLVIALLVFVSTLTTRQHVIVDVAGGVLVSEITYWAGKRTEWWHYVEREFDQVADRLFPGGENAGSKKRIPVYWGL